MSSRTQRGFSLIEVLVTSVILTFLMGAVFWAFDFGSRSFYQTSTQQSSQGEMTRVYSRLRKDLRHTHFRTVHSLERTLQGSRRDALSLASLKEWSAESSFDELNGLPKWDRYVVYYGTESGQLIRSNLDPAFPDYSAAPFQGLSETEHLNQDPLGNDGALQSSFRVVSRSVSKFEVSLTPEQDMVSIKILLKSGQGRKAESSELRLDISPQNTWPKA